MGAHTSRTTQARGRHWDHRPTPLRTLIPNWVDEGPACSNPPFTRQGHLPSGASRSLTLPTFRRLCHRSNSPRRLPCQASSRIRMGRRSKAPTCSFCAGHMALASLSRPFHASRKWGQISVSSVSDAAVRRKRGPQCNSTGTGVMLRQPQCCGPREQNANLSLA
jgi:hypothetical protein